MFLKKIVYALQMSKFTLQKQKLLFRFFNSILKMSIAMGTHENFSKDS
jgi:hypothetical protein